jgi:hypothetical protein
MPNDIHAGLGNNAYIPAAPAAPLKPLIDVGLCRGVDAEPPPAFTLGGPSAFLANADVAAQVGRMPGTTAAADKLLKEVKIQISEPLGRNPDPKLARAELKPAHQQMSQIYRDVYSETLGAEVKYAQDRNYQMRSVSDEGGKAFGVASGWFLGGTGFQIDYLSPIEHPRPEQEQRDVTAGLAMMRKLASSTGAGALWVEVDAKMREHYVKAGFVDLAAPHTDDPAQLTMMVLPVSPKMKKALSTEDGKTQVWLQHITAWYNANWEDPNAAGAKDALDKMRSDAASGKRTWFQALPAE